MAPHDEADGCDADFTVDPTPDHEIDMLVLFAGVPPDQVAQHAADLRALLGGGE